MPLRSAFDDLADPRRDTQNKLHRLNDILTIATCAVAGGAEMWDTIVKYRRAKADFSHRHLKLDNSVPRTDTFGPVFAEMAQGAFAQVFIVDPENWTTG